MKQKELTEKQNEVIARLEAILKEAQENHVGFVYDCDDCSLSAFNAENIDVCYCGRYKESDNDEKVDWDFVSMIQNFKADYFYNGFDDYYLHFNDEAL